MNCSEMHTNHNQAAHEPSSHSETRPQSQEILLIKYFTRVFSILGKLKMSKRGLSLTCTVIGWHAKSHLVDSRFNKETAGSQSHSRTLTTHQPCMTLSHFERLKMTRGRSETCVEFGSYRECSQCSQILFIWCVMCVCVRDLVCALHFQKQRILAQQWSLKSDCFVNNKWEDIPNEHQILSTCFFRKFKV